MPHSNLECRPKELQVAEIQDPKTFKIPGNHATHALQMLQAPCLEQIAILR